MLELRKLESQNRGMAIGTISKNYVSEISVQALYEAWLSPDMAIDPVTKIEVDAREGGFLRLFAESPDGTFVMNGKLLELIENQKIRYTWKWDESAEETIVTVTFHSNNGKSEIRLGHDGFQTQESKDLHDSGWDQYFTRLEKKILDDRD